MATAQKGAESLTAQLGLDRLAREAQGLGQAMADKGVSAVTDKVEGLVDRLGDVAGGTPAKSVKAKAVKNIAKGDSAPKAAMKAGVGNVTDTVKEGASSVKGKLSEVLGGGGSQSKDKKLKVTNIVEEIDVPVPRDTAYQMWTQFEEFPSFMKKVENVEQKSDETVEWTAQILWSHRSWTAKIVDQVPNERIVWRSKGDKGHVDGAVTFHELAPDLTRILIVLEYHPQGFFEHTGNLWRAQGRRARLELKHFRRYVTTQTLLNQEDVDGWPGEIHEGKVARKGGRNGSKRASSRSGSKKTASSGGSKKTASSGASKKTAASSSGSKKTASSSSGGAKKASSSGPRKTSKSASGSGSSRSRKTAKSASSSSSGSSSSRARKTAKSSRSGS
jgi:uncharacterized membrane protein